MTRPETLRRQNENPLRRRADPFAVQRKVSAPLQRTGTKDQRGKSPIAVPLLPGYLLPEPRGGGVSAGKIRECRPADAPASAHNRRVRRPKAEDLPWASTAAAIPFGHAAL